MNHVKPRLLYLGLIVLSVGLIYDNWHELLRTHKYSMKIAAFAPLCGVGGLFLMVFPAMAGKPNTNREKAMGMIAFAVGLVAGLVNWYLMDPRFFGR